MIRVEKEGGKGLRGSTPSLPLPFKRSTIYVRLANVIDELKGTTLSNINVFSRLHPLLDVAHMTAIPCG